MLIEIRFSDFMESMRNETNRRDRTVTKCQLVCQFASSTRRVVPCQVGGPPMLVMVSVKLRWLPDDERPEV